MRLAVLCVALAACGINPAFDPHASTGSPADTSAAPSTEPGPASSGPSGPSDPSDPTSTSTMSVDASGPGDSSGAPTTTTAPTSPATSTTDNTTDNTTGPACAVPGEPCDEANLCCGCSVCTAGTCVANDALCTTCFACNSAGACEQAKLNAPCLPPLEACPQQIWGLEGGTCYATQPFGKCDKDAACIPDCVDKGAVLAGCHTECLRNPHPCTSDNLAENITTAALCHNEGTPAGDCVERCSQNGLDIELRYCDAAGACQPGDVFSCSPYLCEGMPPGCSTNCMSSEQCAPMHACMPPTCI